MTFQYYSTASPSTLTLDQTKALFQQNTLIWPCVSFGNVGQLAVDLMVNTLLATEEVEDFQRAGYLYSNLVLPIAGQAAFASQSPDSLCLNFEVYHSPSKKLVFIQQRAFFSPQKEAKFAKQLIEWVQECGFRQVVVFSSVDDMFRKDPQINRRHAVYYVSASAETKILRQEYVETKPTLEIPVSLPAFDEDDQPLEPQAPEVWASVRGAGIAPALHQEAKARHVPLVTLFLHCAEGDNVPDAVSLCDELANYLELQFPTTALGGRYVYPPSWSELFGRQMDYSLF